MESLFYEILAGVVLFGPIVVLLVLHYRQYKKANQKRKDELREINRIRKQNELSAKKK